MIMSNRHDESHIGSYRSLSAKRLRDPSRRKSVSFNDVPIVHEVPSYDTMRNSNSDIYPSWTYTDAILPYSSSQVLLPFNSTSAAAQKLHAHRLSSTLYSSANSTTLNRVNDWPVRTKTMKSFEETTEHQTNSNPPLIIIHTPDEQIIQNSSISSENQEEKKHLYRSPMIPDNEHYRSLPFTYVPVSESTSTYTSMLTTNLIQSNNQIPNGHTRTLRARSATLPITLPNSSIRNNDNIRTTTTTTNILSSRTVLKPATIAVHGSTNTSSSFSKPPTIPPRSSSFTVHSRLSRPLSSIKPLTSSTTLTRSRSANILSSKRSTTSSVVMLDGQSGGTKRNPNIKQSYGSYYIHPVLLPANIN